MDPLTSRRAPHQLYPPVDPFDQRMLDVGDGHRVYVEQCGAPGGVPVVILHGGPGGGCSPVMRRYFDPQVYRVILFDQRGCGRSRPHASVVANTTWHLVADIERIRMVLGIERWMVFGGSWGARAGAGLCAGASRPGGAADPAGGVPGHAARARLVLRRRGGAVLARPLGALPGAPGRGGARPPRRGLCPAALLGERAGGDAPRPRLGRVGERALASIANDGPPGESPGEYARAFARLENHYFRHGAFMREDGQLLKEAGRLAGIPGIVVQGRYDMICPPASAWALAKVWDCELKIVPRAGPRPQRGGDHRRAGGRDPTACGTTARCAGWPARGLARGTSPPRASTTGLRRVPIPSTPHSITSPGHIHSCGSRPAPTPAGVPVAMTSPGSSVMPCDRSAMSWRHVEEQELRVRALLLLAVLGQPEVEDVGVRDLVGGDDARGPSARTRPCPWRRSTGPRGGCRGAETSLITV